MKAMILAAGKGTRLGSLTAHHPKALVSIHSHPALYWIILRLHHFGVQNILINTHSFAKQIHSFVNSFSDIPSPFSAQLSISHEVKLLNTGGGILKTEEFWGEESFFVHNVDVFSTANLNLAYAQHQEKQALVTLFTQTRPTQTRLLIDEKSNICGIHYQKKGEYRLLRPPQGAIKEQGFCGIHIIQPRLLDQISESGSFSIIDSYLRLIQEGHCFHAFDITDAYWKDIGTPEGLSALIKDWDVVPNLRELHGGSSS